MPGFKASAFLHHILTKYNAINLLWTHKLSGGHNVHVALQAISAHALNIPQTQLSIIDILHKGFFLAVSFKLYIRLMITIAKPTYTVPK